MMTQLSKEDHQTMMADMRRFDEQMPCVGIQPPLLPPKGLHVLCYQVCRVLCPPLGGRRGGILPPRGLHVLLLSGVQGIVPPLGGRKGGS